MNKKALSERDICTKFITPALVQSGWDVQNQIREEVYFTQGRVVVRGKLHSRGEASKADYVLYHQPNLPIAIIEAKDNNHKVGDGMQQALKYSDALDVPFVFSSNGDGFLFHDRTGKNTKPETEISIDSFPTPTDLWNRYCEWKGIKNEQRDIIETPYYDDGSGRLPRYYQVKAINRAIEAVAKGQKRLLFVMATGSGKTYTAFQIIWRLWKAKQKKRILFLVDRNVLADDPKRKDFKPFGQAMTKISKRQIDKSYEIYLSLYQAVTGTEEEKNIYKQFTPDFFDLIVVDECHRGSAASDSNWHEILNYFKSATHIGFTATPKETKDVSNITYFGEPLYTYSLKQGIEDGFLAPYKVVRIDFDKDLEGWRPDQGMTDKSGAVIEDRIYNQKDFDRTLVLEKRTELVAKKITQFLEESDPYQKTIVFCDDIDHAERMRQALVNANPTRIQENRKYVMRMTGDEKEGKAELDNFINPEKPYPVIATTSELLTTGVDVKTCKLIVLDKVIQSMTQFKQIIGRGTRIDEDFNKFWFTIMDFKKATELFADEDFDGAPVVIFEPKGDESPVPPDDLVTDPTDTEESGTIIQDPFGEPDEADGEPRKKYVVGNVPVYVAAERVQYYGPDGKLITESMRDYTRKCIHKQYTSLNDFIRKWKQADKKVAIIEELASHGILWEALKKEIEKKVGKSLDPFDLVCHVAFDQPPLSRRERSQNVKKRNYFTRYGDKARLVLEALLDKYADAGIENIEDIKVLQIDPFNKMGTPPEIVKIFGSKEEYIKAVQELENQLYA